MIIGARRTMARDPFTYLFELRRKYVRDWYWFSAGVVAIGLGIAISAGLSHVLGLVAGVGVMLIGLFVGYLGYRRGLPLSASQHGYPPISNRSESWPTDPGA
jgi:hypothetical protein